jgi:hypothetical protein
MIWEEVGGGWLTLDSEGRVDSKRNVDSGSEEICGWGVNNMER